MLRHLQFVSVLAAVWATVRLAEAGADCTGINGFKCDSCSTLALCSGDSIVTTFPCQSDEMCEEGTDEIGSCMLISESSRTKCKCDTFPSYVVDSYDPQKYLLCFSDTLQIPLTCPSGEEFDEATNQCAAIPPTTSVTTSTVVTTTQPTVSCTEAGLFPLLPSCSGYYGCYPAGASLVATDIVYCTDPQVFNPDTLACVASIEAPGKPTCGASDIVAADTLECNAFYVCISGSPVGEKICCAEGEVFNPDTIRCEADTGSVTCPTENPCLSEDVEKSCVFDTSTTVTTASPTSSSSTSITSSSTASSASSSASTSLTDSGTASPSVTDSSSTASPSVSDSSSTASPSVSDSSSTASPSVSDSSSTASTSVTDSSSSASPSVTDSSSTVTTSVTDSSSTVTTSVTDSSSTVTTSVSDSSSTASTSVTDSSSITSTATTPSATTTGPPDCTVSSGSFSYPGDCKKYYFCYQGQLAEQTCTGTLIFSPDLGCTLDSNYDCPY